MPVWRRLQKNHPLPGWFFFAHLTRFIPSGHARCGRLLGYNRQPFASFMQSVYG